MFDTIQFLKYKNTRNLKSRGVDKQYIITSIRKFHLNTNVILFGKSQSMY